MSGKQKPVVEPERYEAWGTLVANEQFNDLTLLLQDLAGEDQVRAESELRGLISTAAQISTMCHQFTLMSHHAHQVQKQSESQRQVSKQQLQEVLQMIGGYQTAVSLPTIRTPPVNVPTLWQRLSTFLGLITEKEPLPSLSPSLPISPELAETDPMVVEPAVTVSPAAGASKPAMLIYCLGIFRVFQDNEGIGEWNGQKGVAILKYLVAHHGRPIAKEVLMDIFWPDADVEAARRNLHQAIYALRQTLRRQQPDLQHIRYENDSYLLNPEMEIWIDYQEFEQRVQNGRYLEANNRSKEAIAEYGIAVGLYEGNFLSENMYDDWAMRQREYLLNQYLRIADRLINYYQQQNENTAAIALCHKLLNLDPCYEPAHRHLMICFLAQGQRHLAVRQYQTCMQTLKSELDLMPDKETIALYQHLL